MFARILKANSNHDELGRFSSKENAVAYSVSESSGADGSQWVTIADSNGRGSIQLSSKEAGVYQVRESLVELAHRGRGVGKALYKKAMDYAEKHNADLTSDEALSESANRVWESLARDGYRVSRQPDVRLSNGKLRSFEDQEFAGVKVSMPTGIPPWRFHGKK